MYWDKSDSYEVSIDAKTGKIVPYNPKDDITHNGKIRKVQIPYAFKLLLQELQSMGISSKIETED
jgi:DNA-directed RNA polymerase beta subunit